MKKMVATVKEMTPAAMKRTIWREGLAYRYRRYAGANRLVPCVDEYGKQWSKWSPIERIIYGIKKIVKRDKKWEEMVEKVANRNNHLWNQKDGKNEGISSMNEDTTPNSPASQPSAPVSFTVCPRCHYPGLHPDQRSWASKGGKAKVKKGFAVIGQPSTEARKLGWVKRKARAEAKAKAEKKATTEQPPQ